MSVIIRYHCRITNVLDNVDKHSLNTEDTISVKAYHEIRRLLKLPLLSFPRGFFNRRPYMKPKQVKGKIENWIDKLQL